MSLSILVSCASDDLPSDINVTVPLVHENSLIVGQNNIHYDKSKQLNTLIYYAVSPVTNNYYLTNSYSIEGKHDNIDNGYYHKNIPQTLQENTENKYIKEIVNEKNRQLQKLMYENSISPIVENNKILKRSIPQNINIGSKWNNIWLLNISNDTFSTINATCIAVSEYAYFFLQDGLTVLTKEQIEEIKTAFDKDYQIVHKYYGEETDTDGNGKVAFLIADIEEDVLGFFYSADKYSQKDIMSTNYKSNEADILYINHYYFRYKNWEKYKDDIKSTFIHEFQHMVLFDTRNRLNLNPSVDFWINEGLSMLAEYYGGYTSTIGRYIESYFAKEQGKSLITNDSTQSYGLSYLFIRYMQIRFGDEFVQKIYSSSKTSIRAIEDATDCDFNMLFLDFIKMVFVTGRNITTDSRYNIKEFNYPEGTKGYNQNGFNLSELIDEVYSYKYYSNDNSFITYRGYTNKTLELYSFFITKWSNKIDVLNISGRLGIAGIYYAFN